MPLLTDSPPSDAQVPGKPSFTWRDGIAILLVLALSIQLLRTKKDVVTLRDYIDRTTGAFITGAPLPPMFLRRASDGSQAQLTDYCAAKRVLVVLVTSKHCNECERVVPEWTAYAAAHPTIQMVNIAADGFTDSTHLNKQVVYASTSPAVVVSDLRIDRVPAVVVADENCHIAAAGLGELGVRSVFARFFVPTTAGTP
jgi:hypothetical protein